MKPNALIIFARYPAIGKTKTRLAATVGHERATQWFRLCVEGFLSQLDGLNADIQPYFCYSDPADDSLVRAWVPQGMPIYAQSGDTLALRNLHACAYVFALGAQSVIITATDVPDLTSANFNDAFARLDRGADLVMAPEEDGGYVYLGMRSHRPEIFDLSYLQGLGWAQQIETYACTHQLSLEICKKLHGIDTGEDLATWIATQPKPSKLLTYSRTLPLSK